MRDLKADLQFVNNTKPNYNDGINWLAPLLILGYIKKEIKGKQQVALITVSGKQKLKELK